MFQKCYTKFSWVSIMSKRKKLIILISLICCMVIAVGVVCLIVLHTVNSKALYGIEDTLPDGKGRNAKVVILAGQSNAAGCSLNEYLRNNVSDEKYSEYTNGYDNVYINYYSTGYNVSNKFVKVVIGQGDTVNYFGPEVGLAEKLHQLYPDELFFIIKFACSGSSLYSNWLSPSSDGETGVYYPSFVKFVQRSMNYLNYKGYNAKIEAMCWMQGESDSFFVETATNYQTNLNNFIADIRSDLSSYAAGDGIGFVDAYIADNPMYWVYCDLVNQSKQAVADMSDLNVVIDTITKGLDCSQEPEDTPDMAHYDSLSEIKLGHLFAEHVVGFF